MLTITHQDKILAIIIRASDTQDGVEFFTPNDFSQQLAAMRHPQGKTIEAHTHNIVPREVSYTKEVLVIRRGTLRVDFYDEQQQYIESRLVATGDVILLAYGGHGFECLTEVDMIEIKQGPYLGDRDKVRFPSVSPQAVNLRD